MIALFALLGCGGATATIAPVGEVGVATEDAPARPFRRMNIDQLAASIEAVSGVAWTEREDEEDVRLFDTLSGSLGKPDYLSSTHEELSPGLLFQKFLDDAAKDVCTTWAEAERSRPAAERTLLVHVEPDDTLAGNPDGVAANVAAALLRFHGHVVDPADAAVEPWSLLFARGAEATGDPVGGWKLVCVGLFTHPDFYTF
ncbi:MAG: hypothetical protein ACK4YP_03265 [Myxococcota bacterium]